MKASIKQWKDLIINKHEDIYIVKSKTTLLKNKDFE